MSAAAPRRPARLVVASANPHKAAELRQLLERLAPGIELLERPAWVPEVEETGSSLAENARLKAAVVAAATGEVALADDTGLEVAALGGAPGIYAARYAGPGASYADNVAKLLRDLDEALTGSPAGSGRPGAGRVGDTEQRPPAGRSARFVTVALLRWPDGGEASAEGSVLGSIAAAPRGDDGFGYDPVFVPDEGDGRSFAEMSAAEKASLSHRARALAALAAELG